MATLKPIHDLSPFTTDKGQKYALGNVKYDADSQRLVATDGCIAITAHVEGNSCPSVLLPAKSLAALIGKGAEMTGDDKGVVKIGGKAAPKPHPGPFPDVGKHLLPSEQPNVLWCISPKYLRKLAEHAENAKADVIHFGIRAEHNKKLGLLSPAEVNSKDSGVSFFFYPAEGEEPVTGVVMPCQLEDPALVREGFRKATAGTVKAAPAVKPPASKSKPATEKPAARVKAESKPKSPRAKAKPSAASLRQASLKGDAAAVEQLIAAGADVNEVDGSGFTSLTRAAARGHAAVVKLLLDGGANPSHQPKCGTTALHSSCWNGHTEVVKLLLAAKAKVSLKDTDGDTPLANATAQGHAAIIKLLKGKV